jgi:outer membrane lipoprotein-sorting protein
MSGKFDQNPSFQADLKETENLEITLTPTGKNMTGMIENIFITLSKKDKAVKTVKIVENENSVTRIDFTGTIINKAIPEEIFQDVQ